MPWGSQVSSVLMMVQSSLIRAITLLAERGYTEKVYPVLPSVPRASTRMSSDISYGITYRTSLVFPLTNSNFC